MRTLALILLLTAVVWSQPPAQRETVGGPPRTVGRAAPAPKHRIKDLVKPAGLNTHSLIGYGLVVGLNNTGDSSVTLTSPMMSNLLERLGLRPTAAAVAGMKSRNVAVVAVTAELPALAYSGDSIDVTASSLGDAKSIHGGTLLQSLLRGPDGQIYASAQGRLEPPPLATQGGGGGGVKPAVVARVAGGGTVAKELKSPALTRKKLRLELHHPDFTTATRIAEKITFVLGTPARAISDSAVEVDLANSSMDLVTVLSRLEDIKVEGDSRATVIIDRATGTVAVTGDTRIGAATVSHGGITVKVGPEGADVSTVLDILRQSAASPDDVAAVFEALHRVGALQAELSYR